MLNFSLCSDNVQCSNRLNSRKEETDLVGFVGIFMLRLQMLEYIQEYSEKELMFLFFFFNI